MIIRQPLKKDAAGKCTRWRVKIWNKETQKNEWHTVHGTQKDAQALERRFKDAQASGVYISTDQRFTVTEVFEKWLRHLKANNRRTSTVACYESDIRAHVLEDLGAHGADKLRKHQVLDHFAKMRADGASTATVNRTLRSFKALMYFAYDSELVSRPIMRRVKQLDRVEGERTMNRGAFTEAEVRRILAEAKPTELALIGLLAFGGPRPGEVYALDCAAVDCGDPASVRIERSWDHRGRKFVKPKTKAGSRTIPISPWLADALRAQVERVGGEGLVFPSENGTPRGPSNFRRDVWLPLKKRAKVRNLDLYSLRHTFTSMARASGEHAFNVSRALGQSKSLIVDTVYAHTMASGLESISANVTERVMGKKPALRVIEGGRRARK